MRGFYLPWGPKDTSHCSYYVPAPSSYGQASQGFSSSASRAGQHKAAPAVSHYAAPTAGQCGASPAWLLCPEEVGLHQMQQKLWGKEAAFQQPLEVSTQGWCPFYLHLVGGVEAYMSRKAYQTITHPIPVPPHQPSPVPCPPFVSTNFGAFTGLG